MNFRSLSLVFLGALGVSTLAYASEDRTPTQIIEVKASDRDQRSAIARLGFALEDVSSDRVYIWGNEKDAAKIKAAGFQVTTSDLPMRILNDGMDTTTKYHTYAQVESELAAMEKDHSDLVTLMSLGKSLEGRDIPMIRISGQSLAQAEANKLPVAFYMGCHHAREHLSVEIPLMFAQYLVSQYAQNADVKRLLDSRELYVAPLINPDGHVFDFKPDGRGKMWRKNRAHNADGTYGVDLNRNYGYGWGANGGASDNPSDETFMGPKAFSEPETRTVRDFINAQPRMTTLLTFHSYSELILYPWGHTQDPIGTGEGKAEDQKIFTKMGQDMAQWNGYTPEASSTLYTASGDTTDWAYGEHGIYAFTFELSPKAGWGGTFYPGDKAIDPTFAANLKPMMYLLEYTDAPKRALDETAPSFLVTPAKVGLGIADYRDAVFAR